MLPLVLQNKNKLKLIGMLDNQINRLIFIHHSFLSVHGHAQSKVQRLDPDPSITSNPRHVRAALRKPLGINEISSNISPVR